MIDEQYQVTLDATKLFACQTVGDVVALVEKG